MKIGILGFQGDYEEHANILKSLGVEYEYVKLPEQLDYIDALILPGGESTHFSRIIEKYDLEDPLRNFDRPILGTCAGIILLSEEVLDEPTGVPLINLGKLNISVRRNAYGRQRESFEAPVVVNGKEIKGVFIRAPKIVRVGEGVDVIAELGDEVVGVIQNKVIGLTFHPELSGETFFHRLLLDMVSL